MAFNPFSAFQKNQKLWMAGILLVCMITFVFCTGMGNSDVGERLLLLFRKSGPTVVSVGGYNLSYSDLIKMRSDRNMCNEFMRKCTDLAIGNLTKVLVEENKKAIGTDKKKEEERQKQLMQIADMRASLQEKMRK